MYVVSWYFSPILSTLFPFRPLAFDCQIWCTEFTVFCVLLLVHTRPFGVYCQRSLISISEFILVSLQVLKDSLEQQNSPFTHKYICAELCLPTVTLLPPSLLFFWNSGSNLATIPKWIELLKFPHCLRCRNSPSIWKCNLHIVKVLGAMQVLWNP